MLQPLVLARFIHPVSLTNDFNGLHKRNANMKYMQSHSAKSRNENGATPTVERNENAGGSLSRVDRTDRTDRVFCADLAVCADRELSGDRAASNADERLLLEMECSDLRDTDERRLPSNTAWVAFAKYPSLGTPLIPVGPDSNGFFRKRTLPFSEPSDRDSWAFCAHQRSNG